MSVAVTMFAMAVLVAGGFGWALAITKISLGQPVVAWSPRRPAPWAIVDLAIVIGLYLLLLVGSTVALHLSGWLPSGDDGEMTLGQRQALTFGGMSVSVLTILIGLPLIALRSGARAGDLGFRLRQAGHDLLVGVAAFSMLAPPVLALQGLLVYFWKESKHPLIELFKGTPDAVFFLMLVAAAVIVAPLVEELLFRVLLQGFLEKLATFRGEFHELFFGAAASSDRQPATVPDPIAGSVPFQPHVAPATSNPYQSPAFAPWQPPELPTDAAATASKDIATAAEQPELRGWQAAVPIVISSLIFALLHYNHGPDWVPLTLLALGMGFVYQRTHSLLPSLVVHVLLNGFSMWIFWIQVFLAPK
jgi:membrane protease YdiL (CAAX protease family)